MSNGFPPFIPYPFAVILFKGETRHGSLSTFPLQLYPKQREEKRLLDAMLLVVPR
jgi:hypothetical protein